MDQLQLKNLLQAVLDEGLLLDLVDAITARALSAHTLIRDHADLDARRSRQVEGRLRFPMQEQDFQKVCLEHGGTDLGMDILPGTNLKVFQPFMRFTRTHSPNGVVLGFAAMPDPSTLPAKNMSREAGESLNYYFQDRLDLDDKGPKVGDVFVLFLAARDRLQAGMVKEIAIAVVDLAYEEFVFYESVEAFIASYREPAPSLSLSAPQEKDGLNLQLRKSPKRFEAPEATNQKETTKK